VQGSTALAVLSADLHSFIQEVILRQGKATMRTGESPCAAMWMTVSPCLLIA
jgi:hypothetical protein